MNRVRREGWRFLVTHRDSLRLWRMAPFVLLIVMVPEFVQHVFEIRIGMFESLERFRDLAQDPTRWEFGNFKIAGVFLSILFAARFWANHARGARWWSLAGISWKQVVLGIVIQILGGLPNLLAGSLDPRVSMAITVAAFLITLPGLVLMIGGILGDHKTGLVDVYRRGWAKGLRFVLHAAPGWALLQMLHQFDHTLAMGQPTALVWALMAWDTLVVGQMTALAGTALHHGYFPPDENGG